MTDKSEFVNRAFSDQPSVTEADPLGPAIPASSADDQQAAMGRRARKAQAVRRALFIGGLTAFERQPIGLVSVLDITESADVAKGVFYLHFKSKDEYLLSLWKEVQERFLAAIDAACGADDDLKTRRLRILQRLAAYHVEHSAAARFWLRMLSYFRDEVGEPGHLDQIRNQYTRRLGAVLSGTPIEALTSEQIRCATIIDAASWSLIGAALHSDAIVWTAEQFIDTVGRLADHLTADRTA